METLEELIKEAKELLIKLCPPDEYGEDYDAETLYSILTQIENKQFKQ